MSLRKEYFNKNPFNLIYKCPNCNEPNLTYAWGYWDWSCENKNSKLDFIGCGFTTFNITKKSVPEKHKGVLGSFDYENIWFKDVVEELKE